MKAYLILVIIFFLNLNFTGIMGAQNISSDRQDLLGVDSVLHAMDSAARIQKDTLNQTAGNRLERLKPPELMDIISWPKILWSIILIVIGYFAIQITTRVVEIIAKRYPKHRFTVKSAIPIIRIFGWIFIVFIVTAGVFRPPYATIIAFSASVFVAIGFASQDILKNIFGGITILLDKPFNVGDKIEIGKYYGEVVEIGLRSTRIVTPDDSLVTVPNSEIMNQSLANANTGASNCQVVTEIYLPISVDTAAIRALATEVVRVSKYVYLKKPIVVLFSHEVKERKTYLKMKMKAYVFDIRDEFKFKSDMTELVIKELVAKGIINER
jgi:small-conductance mechanosensitive channel